MSREQSKKKQFTVAIVVETAIVLVLTYSLHQFDIECMRKIGSRCNLIPVISKGDSLTEAERVLNKELISNDIQRAGIQVFQFERESGSAGDEGMIENGSGAEIGESSPFLDGDNNLISGVNLELQRLQKMIPFCVMSSGGPLGSTSEGNTIEFPWGVARLNDAKGNELGELKSILLSTHTQELKDTTNENIYEKFRTEKLQPSS